MDLIAEGGGLRGIFTAGVLDAFMDAQFNPFKRVLGISSGALNLAYYLSQKKGVFRNSSTQLFLAPNFILFRNIFNRKKEIMDLDWFFKTIRESYPFDFEEIKKYVFYIGCTDYNTGKAIKTESKDVGELYRLLLASCATPGYYNKRLDFNSTRYVDGTLSDPVPVKSMLGPAGVSQRKSMVMNLVER